MQSCSIVNIVLLFIYSPSCHEIWSYHTYNHDIFIFSYSWMLPESPPPSLPMIQTACPDMKRTAVIMRMHFLYCPIIIHNCIVVLDIGNLLFFNLSLHAEWILMVIFMMIVYLHMCILIFCKNELFFHGYSWLSGINMFEPTVCPGGQHTTAITETYRWLHITHYYTCTSDDFFLFLEFWLFLGWKWGRDWNSLFLNAGIYAWYAQLSQCGTLYMCMYVSLCDSSLGRYRPCVHTFYIVYVAMYSHICKKYIIHFRLWNKTIITYCPLQSWPLVSQAFSYYSLL